MLEKYENNLKLLEEFKKMKGDKLDVVITHIKITTNNMDKDNVLVLRVEVTEESKEIFKKFSQNKFPHITGLCFKKSNGKMTAPFYSNEALKDSIPGKNIKVKIPFKLVICFQINYIFFYVFNIFIFIIINIIILYNNMI